MDEAARWAAFSLGVGAVRGHLDQHGEDADRPPARVVVVDLDGDLMLFGVTDASIGRSLREAGSSVTTLGFESTGGAGPTAIDVLAGVSGLVVIALTIAHLPTVYVILRDRETPVKVVSSRVGRHRWRTPTPSTRSCCTSASLGPRAGGSPPSWPCSTRPRCK